MKLALLFATVILASAPAFSAEPVKKLADISGKEWIVSKVVAEGAEVPLGDDVRITLSIDEGGKVSGQGPVNRYFGKLELNGKGSCQWDPAMGSTRMAGTPERMTLESLYLKTLPTSTVAEMEDGALTFRSDNSLFAISLHAAPAVEGKLVFGGPQDATIPTGAKVTVEIDDVSRADAAAVVIGKVEIEDATQFPVSFRIPYDPTKIVAGMSYALSARIEGASGPLFISDTVTPVFQDGAAPSAPTDVNVVKVP